MQSISMTLTSEQAVVLLGLLASSQLASEPSSEQRLLHEIARQLERKLLEPPPSESTEFVAALLTRENAA